MTSENMMLCGRDLFRLMKRAHTKFLRDIACALRYGDLSATQYYVLDLLASKEAETPSQCARLLKIDVGAMTRVLDSLEQRDLIVRCYPQKGRDRRLVLLQVQASGLALYNKVSPHMEMVQRQFLGPLSSDGVTHLTQLLGQVCGNSDLPR
jgi:DNA-binding MarR family transcriptional regulator